MEATLIDNGYFESLCGISIKNESGVLNFNIFNKNRKVDNQVLRYPLDSGGPVIIAKLGNLLFLFARVSGFHNKFFVLTFHFPMKSK